MTVLTFKTFEAITHMYCIMYTCNLILNQKRLHVPRGRKFKLARFMIEFDSLVLNP